MANRLVNLFVKNVAAVERPANRRTFLVIKGALKKDDHAMTFDDAMFGRRIGKVYMALSEHYGALMETVDSIRYSQDEDKPKAVKAAMSAYLAALTKAMPSIMDSMDTEDEEAKKEDKKIDPERRVKLKVLKKTLDDLITEGEANMEKKAPDAGALTKMGHAIAAMFGKAAGADDATIAALEKAAAGDPPAPEVPAEVQVRLSKAETEAIELKARLQKAEEETAKLREEGELRKFAEEVSGYRDIGLDPSKDAALLKAVTEKLPKEQSDRIRELFKAAVAQAQAAKLFGEVGSSGAGAPTSGSAAEEVETKTATAFGELRKSSDKATVEQARDSVFRSNPGLYERWARETTVKV